MKPNNKISNILIFSLDCVRREAIGCYPQRFPLRVRLPKSRKTSNIDFLSSNGHRFDQAVTHAPFTPAAHASLFTGLIPPNHGLRKFLRSRLNEKTTTLAQLLSLKGWKCGAVVGSHALSKEFGMERGFDFYDDDIKTGIKRWNRGERRGAHEVTDKALSWLSSLESEDYFFLFVHYFDAHNYPSKAAPEERNISHQNVKSSWRHIIRNRLPEKIIAVLRPFDETIRSVYYAILRRLLKYAESFLSFFELSKKFRIEGRRFMLNQVSDIDNQIGRILNYLSSEDKLDKTMIIVLADHGDDFMEHGEPTHRKYLYDSTLVVPLIIYPNFGGQSVISNQVRLIDIYPTLTSLLNIELDNQLDLDGRSLLPIISNNTNHHQQHDAYSETLFEVIEENKEIDVLTCYASLRSYPWKMIWNRLDNKYELYRLDKDPSERHNIVQDHPKLTQEMARELAHLAKDLPEGLNSRNNILEKRLEALGYL
jgi:arylsulfatase